MVEQERIEQEKRRWIYRFPPCPWYDVEGVQSWLEEMAAEGFHLCKDGFWFGLVQFERGSPQQVRYRLQAAEKQVSMWNDDGGYPDDESRELTAEMGWQFVSSYGEFFIYRADSREAVELDTDPTVQALALEKVRGRQKSSVVSYALWFILYPLARLRFRWVSAWVSAGTPIFLGTVWLALSLFWSQTRTLVRLSRLKKRLEAGEPLTRRSDWRSRATRHHFMRVFDLALLLLWIVLLLRAWSVDILQEDRIALEEYQGDLPFVTLEEFLPELEPHFWQSDRDHTPYEERSTYNRYSNFLKDGSDPIAPRILYYTQSKRVTADGKELFDGYIRLEYTQMAFEFLAVRLEEEIYQNAADASYFSPLTCPPVEADSARMYSSIYPTLLIRRGRTVLQVQLRLERDGSPVPPEEWVPVFADFES
ncbi:MAG: DUF2812 domain-containing protein [Clostridia bacterium]|nr:DUF2812 domain-containing protein [Clostridia bacterium]